MMGQYFTMSQTPASPSIFSDKSDECPYRHDYYMKKGFGANSHSKYCTCNCAWCFQQKMVGDWRRNPIIDGK